MGAMANPITVFLIDDHAVVRKGLRAYLETLPDIRVIGEAASGEEAIEQVVRTRPVVVMMDLVMPGMDGVQATYRIKHLTAETAVIVLTSYYEDEYIFPAFQAGALSYLLKDISPEGLVDAIRKAAQGEAVVHPRVAARLVKELQGRQGTRANPFLLLTGRELEVLTHLAGGKSNGEIASTLVISEKTVKSHISSILAKLHLVDRTQAAVFAWQQGIVRKENVPGGIDDKKDINS